MWGCAMPSRVSRAPSSVAERPTFNRQVDGSNPSERANVRMADSFETKLQNPRYAEAYALASRRNRKKLTDMINALSQRVDELEAENALLRAALQKPERK